ncbi:DUF4956 domain-containing protein [Prevotella sp. E13-17]|uniref:DUF4956 domain-containing protein n=1 Tax=Prevotella sp. E13-17 TaxID=2913616 RepID=UPI001EDB5203|nr:DUF4956 domain-containing protein [Prevotella sp. E13-17]UKK49891.1 DUF4956 domain-containing protein [Prevotella sp. E13-17]
MDSIINLFSGEFGNTLLHFAICMLVNWVIIELFYFRKSHRRDFYFTFMLMSVAIFFLVYFMMGIERGKATMGVGLGLFGIFSIMRYRTDAMPVREMTYLFLIICLSVVHAMADSYTELVIVDVICIIAISLCEKKLKIHNTKIIQYDRIDLIKPERMPELIEDLESRTGLSITKVDVGGIDFLRDSAVLRISYEGECVENDINKQYTVRKSQWREV